MVTPAPVALAQAPPPGTGSISTTGYVRVIDGDTLETRIDGNLIGIGIIGIRAARANAACGQLAAQLTNTLVQAPGTRLEEDPTLVLDARKRRLYYVVTPDGRSVARELVKAGLAKPNGKGREVGNLVQDEQDARGNNRGCVNEFPVDKDNKKDLNVDKPVEFLPYQSGSPTATATATRINTEETPAQNETISAKPTLALAALSVNSALSTGFSEQIVAGGFSEPTGFAFLPDGRILVAEKAGRVKLIKNGAVAPTPFIDVRSRVNSYWDHGLLGIVADPNFVTNGFVYLLYTYENDPLNYSGSKTQQLLRVKAIGDTASTSPADMFVVLGKNVGESCNLFPEGSDCIPAHSPNHAIGSLRFGSDGSLFVSMGDDTTYNVVDDDALRVQNTRILLGKILRIDPSTGLGLVTNPFYGETGTLDANSSKVWAYGLRNPFRFGLRPSDNMPLIGDVGWNTYEEVNVGIPGGNFGWPCYEGPARQPGYELRPGCQTLYNQGTRVQAPLYSYDHSAGGASVIGGSVYTGTAYPEQFRDGFFFPDYVRGWIQYLKIDSSNNLVAGTPVSFSSASGGPVDIQAGPNTNLYYLDIKGSRLLQLRYSAGNTPPSASASGTSTQGIAPLQVSFSSAGSFDPNDDVLQYSWNFGDGSAISTSPNPQHTYSTNGTYNAVLTVSDGRGGTDTASVPITVGNRPPVATIAAPSSSVRFKVGDVITFSGSAPDPDSGSLPASALSWQVNLYHCDRGVCHVHPFLQTTGSTGSFTVPGHGGNYYFEIVLTATDSGGLTGTTSVQVLPQTVLITLATEPALLQVINGGTSGASPLTQSSVVGSASTIGALSPQTINGVNYVFSSWSDGGAQQHTIATGTQNATYTATFRTSTPPPSAAVNVSVSPSTSTRGPSQTQQFTASVTGTANTAVTWSISPNVGTISAGGLYTAPASITTQQTVTVTATSQADSTKSGSAVVTLTPGAAAFAPVRVNAGGPSYTDPQGRVWGADAGYSGGSTYVVSTAVANTTTPALYQAERYSATPLTYTFPAPNGTYTVTLKFAEVYFTSAAQRVFNILLNGQTVQMNFDIVGEAGGANRAVDRSYVLNVTNGQIAIQLTPVVQNAKINAIEIVEGSAAVVNVSVAPSTSTRGPSQTQQFSATVTGNNNTAVTWSLNPNVGTISAGGLYTAPTTITTQQTVTVTATSQADPTKSGSATVTLTPPAVSVSVAPSTSTRSASQTQQFTATVTGTANTAVTWSLSPNVGTISAAGLYTAPSSITTQQTVTVTATSQADSTKSGSATITLTPPASTSSGGLLGQYFDNQDLTNLKLTRTDPTISFNWGSASPDPQIAVGTYSVRWTGQVRADFTQAYTFYTVSNDGVRLWVNNQLLVNNWTGHNAIENSGVISLQAGQWYPIVLEYYQGAGTAEISLSWSSAGTPKQIIPSTNLDPTAPQTAVSVSVLPSTSTRGPSQTQQFTATVTGTNNTAVTWSLNPNVGTISAGGLYTAPASITTQQTVTVTATSQADSTKSGSAVVTLTPGAAGFPPIRVNAGGPSYTDPQGRVWAADAGFSSGSTYAVSTAVANTTTPALYQTERYSNVPLTYTFGVPNGTYTVTLKFAEVYFNSAAQRVFDIALNTQTVQMNFDIFGEAGGANRAVDRSYVVNVTNGQIAIRFSPVVQNAKVNAIEIVEGSAAGVNVSVSPSSSTRGPSQTQQFTATVTGTNNTAVTWSLNPNVGTISAGGLYTAPSTITAQQTIVVRATSQVDPTKSGTATVMLIPPSSTSMFAWETKAPSPIGRMEAQGTAVNGKLYAFGGFTTSWSVVTTRADVYDPQTNTWAQIADVPEQLTHSAVAVDGDTIYLIGGYVGGNPGPSSPRVWKYNTVLNSWSAGPTLPVTRGAGAAARVGRFIYFFGGATRSTGDKNDTDQPIAYKLALDGGTSWTRIADIPNPRNHLGGTNLNGKVYAIGGQHNTQEGPGNQVEVDMYDPDTDVWTRVADLPNPRGHIAVANLNGGIVVVGAGPPTAEVTLYDPDANVWVKMPSLPAARASAVAGVIDGALFVATGNPGNGVAATTNWRAVFTSKWELGTSLPVVLGEVAGGIIGKFLYLVGEGNSATLAFDLSKGTWSSGTLATRPYIGNHHAAEVLNGKLYLIGGLGGGSDGRVQIYDPITNSWTVGANMPFAAGSSASAVINGEIFVAGGIIGSNTTAQAAAYNPATNTWRTVASMPQGLNHTASTTDGSKLYVFGGRTGGNVVGNGENTVQIYNPASNSWTSNVTGAPIMPLPQARGGMGKAVYLNGEFYVIGGETLNGSGATADRVYDRVDIYSPTTNSWRLGTPMPTARHGIFPLAVAGRIYVAGGGIVAANSSSGKLEIYNVE